LSGGYTPSFVLATLELGRIAERPGDRGKSAESYRFVMAAWRWADPELLPYVAEAKGWRGSRGSNVRTLASASG
jgi:hypothetical protein